MSDVEQSVVGVDMGKRRIAIGWPYFLMSAYLDMDKFGWSRSRELLGLRTYVTARVPVNVDLWAEIPYLSGGAASNPTTTADLAMSLGAVMSAHEWNSVTLVNPSTWKAAVIGHGNASKEDVQDWLREHRPDLFEQAAGEENRVDAMCIGLYGIMRVTGQVDAPVKKPRAKRKPRGPGTA